MNDTSSSILGNPFCKYDRSPEPFLSREMKESYILTENSRAMRMMTDKMREFPDTILNPPALPDFDDDGRIIQLSESS